MDDESGEVTAVTKTANNIRRLSCSTLIAILVLRDHIKRIKYQPPSVPDVLKDLRSLEQILQNSVDLLNKHTDVSPEDSRLEKSLSRFEIDLQDCLNQINDWAADEALQPSSGKQLNDFLKRIRYAGYREVFGELSTKLAAQRAVLWLHLTFLGRFYDETMAERSAQFEQKLQQLEKEVAFVPNEVSDIQSSTERTTPSSSDYAEKGVEKSDSSYSSRGSLKRYRAALDSMQQKPMRALGQKPAALKVCHWSCDALNGIDDVFEYYGVDGYSVCKLCSFKFYWTDDECFIRQGQHLVKRHALGSCGGTVSFENKADFMTHLVVFHKFMVYDFNQGSPKEWPNKSWIDDLFRRWGSAPESSDIPATKLDGPSQRSASSFSLALLNDISKILQSSGLMQRLDYCYMPKGELTGHPWNASACVIEICNALAKLDNDETAQVLGRREYSRVCYLIGCLQEELVVTGHEELLTLETYKSSAHDALCHSIITDSKYAVTHRVNSCWELPLQDKKTSVYCATLLDALRLQNRTYDRDEAFRRAGPRAIAQLFECLQTEISRSPTASPMGVLRARAIDTPFRLARDPTLSEKELRRAQTLARKIDEWLMGTFVDSIPLRRVLMSGRAIPDLASTTPTSWALKMMEHWTPESPVMQPANKETMEEQGDDNDSRGSSPRPYSYPDSVYSAATMSSMSSSSGTIRVKRLTLFQEPPAKLHKSAEHMVYEVQPEVRPLSSRCSTHISYDGTTLGEEIPQTGVTTLPPD